VHDDATTTSTALGPAVDALLADPLDTLDVAQLQAGIEAVTPQAARLQGWLHAAAGQLDARSGGSVATSTPAGRGRSPGGWRRCSTAPPAPPDPSSAPPDCSANCPLVVAAVLDGSSPPMQATVLTRLVGTIDADALVESQPHLIAVAAPLDPAQLGRG
jgi:hypothetical protein